MPKFISIFLMSLLSSHLLIGQVSFSHTVGGSIYSSTDNTGAGGIMYSPRLNFLELADEVTVSIGTHIGLGLSLNSRSGANSLALDIPLVAEMNFGCASHPDASSGFGGFVGAGYGISRIGSQGAFGSGYNEASGLVFNGGIRTELLNFPVGLRVSYMINSLKDGPEEYKDVYSVGLFLLL